MKLRGPAVLVLQVSTNRRKARKYIRIPLLFQNGTKCTRIVLQFQDHFRTGNVLQFVSRSSGRTLQIVTSPTGALVVDGAGMEGPQVGNGKSAVIGYFYYIQAGPH